MSPVRSFVLAVAALVLAAGAGCSHATETCTGASCGNVSGGFGGSTPNGAAEQSGGSDDDGATSPINTCSTDTDCQVAVSCTCPDLFMTTVENGSCSNGQCFQESDADACATACLTHNAP